MEALVLVIAVGMILGSQVYCIVSCCLAHTSDERVCLSVGGGGGGGGQSGCGLIRCFCCSSSQTKYGLISCFCSSQGKYGLIRCLCDSHGKYGLIPCLCDSHGKYGLIPCLCDSQ